MKRKRNESLETTSGQASAVHRTSAQKLAQTRGLQFDFLTVKASLSAPVRSPPPPSPPTPVLSLRPLLTTSIVCSHSLLYIALSCLPPPLSTAVTDGFCSGSSQAKFSKTHLLGEPEASCFPSHPSLHTLAPPPRDWVLLQRTRRSPLGGELGRGHSCKGGPKPVGILRPSTSAHRWEW